jgi:hypothetical protein
LVDITIRRLSEIVPQRGCGSSVPL